MPCVASGQVKLATCTFIDVVTIRGMMKYICIKHLYDMKIWGYGFQVNDSGEQ